MRLPKRPWLTEQKNAPSGAHFLFGHREIRQHTEDLNVESSHRSSHIWISCVTAAQPPGLKRRPAAAVTNAAWWSTPERLSRRPQLARVEAPAQLGVRAAHCTLRHRRTARPHPPRTAGVRRAAVRRGTLAVIGGLGTVVCAWLIARRRHPRHQKNRCFRACNPSGLRAHGYAARR